MHTHEHDEECTHDCSTCTSDCGGEHEEEQLDEMHYLSLVNKTILIASAKGGVGKSVVTSILANELNKKGYRVGIIDGDLSSGCISLMYGISEKPEVITGAIHPKQTDNNISIISFTMLLPNASAPLAWDSEKCVTYAKQFWTDVIWDNIDFLFVDTPSNTDEVTQMFFNLPNIDGALFVTDPSELGNTITARSINYANLSEVKTIGVIENFSDRAAETDYAKELTDQFEIPLLDKIKYDYELYQLANSGKMSTVNTDILSQTISALEQM